MANCEPILEKTILPASAIDDNGLSILVCEGVDAPESKTAEKGKNRARTADRDDGTLRVLRFFDLDAWET